MKTILSYILLLLSLTACTQGPTELKFGGITNGVANKLVSANYSLQVTDRRFVNSTFKQIFGETPELVAIYKNDVLRNPNYHGVCDPYADITLELPDHDGGRCGGVPQLASSPSMDTVRISHTVKVCEKIMKVTAAIEFATSSVNMSHLATPTSSDIQKAYKQFYPFKEPSAQVLLKFSSLAGLKSEPLESWRLVYLALCISPEWQTL